MITISIESKCTNNNTSFESYLFIDNQKTIINLISPNYCLICRGVGGVCSCQS